MNKQLFIIVILSGAFVLCSCDDVSKDPGRLSGHSPINSQAMIVTSDTLKKILEAFNQHDLDAIMEYFSDDCSFDFPRGPESYGQRFTGKAQVREALAGRFKGIPDVHYGDDRHWVSADGSMGVSEWLLTGTTTAGAKVKVRGCDHWEFRNNKVIRKDSYWKIVEPTK